MEMDKEIVARRLSGAMGKQVDPSSVVRAEVRAVRGLDLVDVELVGDVHFTLAAGNEAFGGPDGSPPSWWRNGERIEPDEGMRALTAKMTKAV